MPCDWLLWGVSISSVLGTTEVWEVYNLTADAHPIHVHLVSFEILNRQKLIDLNTDPEADPLYQGITINSKLQPQHNSTPGNSLTYGSGYYVTLDPNIPHLDIPSTRLAEPNEIGGPKDTAIMYPGEVTRIKMHFDRLGRYVWHCHILSHEDHEMMRPFEVVAAAAPAARLAETETGIKLDSYPNPFSGLTNLKIVIPENGRVEIRILDLSGRLVAKLGNQEYLAGTHELKWSAGALPTGIYLAQMIFNEEVVTTHKLMKL